MMIDFALEVERSSVPPEKAIFDACLVRFRPIMMTTFAALFGCDARSHARYGEMTAANQTRASVAGIAVTPSFPTQ